METTEPNVVLPLRGHDPVHQGARFSLAFHIVAIGIPCTTAVVFILFGLTEAFGQKATRLQGLLMLLYLIFVVILMVLGVALLEMTNASSISGMVAQRYSKVSYLTILMITGISFFTSCFIIAGGIVREVLAEDFDDTSVWLGAFSPLAACCILVLPIVVEKTGNQLHMIPLDDKCIVTAESLAQSTYKLKFFPRLEDRGHQIFHYIAIIVGLGLGYSSVIIQIHQSTKNLISVHVEVALLVVSGICITAFFILNSCTCCCKGSGMLKQATLYYEFLGLFFYLMAIIYSSAISAAFIY